MNVSQVVEALYGCITAPCEQKGKLANIVFLKGFSEIVEGDKSNTMQTIIKKHSKMRFAVCLKLWRYEVTHKSEMRCHISHWSHLYDDKIRSIINI